LATLRFRVPEHEAGARLDQVLAARVEVGSRGAAERLLAAGSVRVDGQPRPKSHRLEGGETVVFELPDAIEPPAVPAIPGLIAFEDEHLLVVDKPAGLAVHPARRRPELTLVDALRPFGPAGGDPERTGIVHRLDRETSGLLVVARTEETHARLSRMVRARLLERRYLALVRGTPGSRSGRIEAPIGRDRHDRTRRSLDTPLPRAAVTHFEVLETMREHALLEVKLETGRTHQIRVHLAAIGLPVTGDATYGAAGDLGLARQFLHAARLAFDHPVTGVRVDVSSPLPPDLEEALARARA
jgi:23S rRNA pseudouridine1911/1915/1917 synthase